MLAPLTGLPLQQLVAMSQGQLQQSVVDDLVRQVNGGTIPEEAEQTTWQEAVTPGRFAGQTVVSPVPGRESVALWPPGWPARVAG